MTDCVSSNLPAESRHLVRDVPNPEQAAPGGMHVGADVVLSLVAQQVDGIDEVNFGAFQSQPKSKDPFEPWGNN